MIWRRDRYPNREEQEAYAKLLVALRGWAIMMVIAAILLVAMLLFYSN